MPKIAVGVLGFLALCALPLFAQSTGNDALLAEVRLIRQALERSASAPQVQLLGTRLTVQNARLQSAMHDHEAARSALQKLTTSIADVTARIEELAGDLRQTVPAIERKQMENTDKALKAELASLHGQESALRGREAELAAAVAAEQNQWLLLNRRLDEIERSLPR
jgi:chromosome segregation ATPase